MSTNPVKRDTVLDWLPSEIHDKLGLLMTRDEVIDHVRRRGVEVNQGNVRSWEHLGVLPLGIRRRHNGATRTLYPTAAVYAILKLKSLQALGLSLDAARPEVKRQFIATAIEMAFIPPEEKFRLLEQVDLRLPDHVIQTLANLAEFQESVSATEIKRIQVTLAGESGKSFVYSLRKIGDDVPAVWKVEPIH